MPRCDDETVAAAPVLGTPPAAPVVVGGTAGGVLRRPAAAAAVAALDTRFPANRDLAVWGLRADGCVGVEWGVVLDPMRGVERIGVAVSEREFERVDSVKLRGSCLAP